MKKTFLLIMFVFLFLSLFSCEIGYSEVAEPDKQGILEPCDIDPTKDVTITCWNAMGQSSSSYYSFYHYGNNFIREMKDKYGVNIKIIECSQGDYITLRKTTASAIAEGNPPTIVQTYPDHISRYLESDGVRSLDDYICHPEYGLEGDQSTSYGYFDSFYHEGSVFDKEQTMYSLPFNYSSEILYYNKTIFEKYNWDVPSTWDDIIDICEKYKLTEEYKQKINDGLSVAGLGVDSEANLVQTLMHQCGSEYAALDEEGNVKLLFNNDKMKNALSWLLSEFNRKNIVTASYFNNVYYCDEAFKNEQCIMVLGSTSGYSYNIPLDDRFEVGLAPYPQMMNATDDEKYVITRGTSVALLKQKDPQTELFGWLFMKYLTNYDSVLEWSMNTSNFPVRKDVYFSDTYQDMLNDSNETEETKWFQIYTNICKLIYEQEKYYYNLPVFKRSDVLRDDLSLLIMYLFYSQDQYKDIDSLLKKLLDSFEKSKQFDLDE